MRLPWPHRLIPRICKLSSDAKRLDNSRVLEPSWHMHTLVNRPRNPKLRGERLAETAHMPYCHGARIKYGMPPRCCFRAAVLPFIRSRSRNFPLLSQAGESVATCSPLSDHACTSMHGKGYSGTHPTGAPQKQFHKHKYSLRPLSLLPKSHTFPSSYSHN